MRHLPWGVATVAAFLLGILLGGLLAGPDWSGARPSAGPAAPGAAGAEQPPAAARPDRGAGAAVRGGPPGADGWALRLRRLDELVRQGDRSGAARLRSALLDEVLAEARAGDPGTAATRLAAYLAGNPHDGRAYLLDSDLRQMRGNADGALQPLFDLLGFADDPATIAAARERLALLVNVRESQLAARGDLPGLIRFLEWVSAGDPQFDGHRLRLARWQLRAGRLDAAARTLAETGNVGVEAQERQDVAAALALARDGLPFEREAGADGNTSALHVRARTRGGSLRLLVDTGATNTVISRARAEALGSDATGRRVQVRTAGGPVAAEVHRLRDVEIGSLQIAVLEVLVLDRALPAGVDGLLGMDVLGRLPNAGGAAPGPP